MSKFLRLWEGENPKSDFGVSPRDRCGGRAQFIKKMLKQPQIKGFDSRGPTMVARSHRWFTLGTLARLNGGLITTAMIWIQNDLL